MVFSCDQAALQMVFSVCLSVCPSVRPSVCLSLLFHHVSIIVSSWNFQELLPWSKVMSMQKVKVRAQRSRSQRSTPNLAVSGLLTPVWIHIWQWNHAHSWKQHRRGAVLFFKVIRQISRSHGSKNRRIWPKLGVSGQQLQFKFTDGYEMLHKAWNSKGEVLYCFPRSSLKFQGHTALKIVEYDPDWAFPYCNSSFNSPMVTKCCTKLEVALKRCPIVFEGHPSNFKVTRL